MRRREMTERGDRLSVLIADDEPSIREALADLIATDPGFTLVGSVEDAPSAVEYASKHRPDVALIDVRMPGGGAMAAREIRLHSPETRIVALSAYEDRNTVLEMLRAGASGYLIKGMAAGEILEALRRSMRGQASLSSEVTSGVIEDLVELLDRTDLTARQMQNLDRTKSEMISLLSHELMTPITVIQGAAATLDSLGGMIAPEDARLLSQSVANATERLRRLVAKVTTTAHLEREDAQIATEPTRLGAIIDAAAAETPGSCDVFYEGSARDAEIWADPELAGRAIALVLENALDFSPDGTRPEVNVRALASEVNVTISDRGPGIPDDAQDEIFSAFTQAEDSLTRTHEGIGIGLYLARKIMAAHGGRIELERREGRGSAFTLTFPAATGQAPAA